MTYVLISEDGEVLHQGDDWLDAVTIMREKRAAGTRCNLYRKTKD